MTARSPVLHGIVAFALTVPPVRLVTTWSIAAAIGVLAALVRGAYVHRTNARAGTPTSWSAEGWGVAAMLIATAIGFVPGWFLPSLIFSRLRAFGSPPPGYERLGAPNRMGSLITAGVIAVTIGVSIITTIPLGRRHPDIGLFATVGAMAGVMLGIALGHV